MGIVGFFATVYPADTRVIQTIQKVFTKFNTIYTPYKCDIVSYASEDLVTLSYPSYQVLLNSAEKRIEERKGFFTKKSIEMKEAFAEQENFDWVTKTSESIKDIKTTYTNISIAEKYNPMLSVNIYLREISIPEKKIMLLLQCASHFKRHQKDIMYRGFGKSDYYVDIYFDPDDSVSMQATGKILELIEKYKQYE